MKRLISFFLAFLIVCSMMSASVFASGEDIHIFYGDAEIVFNKPTTLVNNTIMCEMKPLFTAFDMTYDYNPLTKNFSGSYGDEMFITTIGDDTLTMSGVTVELETPFCLNGRDVMVPLDTLCYIYNIQIDRSDLTNVKLWLKEKDEYDLEAEMEKFGEKADQYKVEIIKGGMEFFDNAERQKPEYFREEYIDVGGQSFDKAYDWEVTGLPATFYASQIVNWSKQPVKEDDAFILSFWAKGIYAKADGGKIQLNITIEKNKTWEKSLQQTVQLTNEWQYFRIVTTAYVDMDDWSLNFRQHFSLQQIQLADVKLDLYTGMPEDLEVPKEPPSYYGMEEDALWRKEALKRIEKYRKNNMVINVTDINGRPIENVQVNAKMTRSEVNWGSNIWPNAFESGWQSEGGTRGYLGQRWLDRFKEMGFNTIVGIVKAESFSSNTWAAKRYAECVNWCIDNDMDMRAHCIYWETGEGIENRGLWLSPEVRDSNWNIDNVSIDEMRDRIELQVNMMATYTGNYPIEIDVMNEMATRHQDAIKSTGWDEGVRMYQMVREICPDAKLVHLETVAGNIDPSLNALPDHIAYIKYLKDLGAPIDIGGIQGHHSTAENPQNWYNCIDAVAQVVDQVAITEYDSAIPDYELRAPYLRDALIAAYSHPAFCEFIVWTYNNDGKTPDISVFWDKNEERHEAYYEWDKLVNKEWKTNETVLTDENGCANIRGHRGRYDITVTVNGKSQVLAMNLTQEEDNNVVNVVVDDEITMTSPNVYIPEEKPEYLNWRNYGKTTEITLPKVNYKWEPRTIIESCRDAEDTLIPYVFDGRNDTFWKASDNEDYLTVTLGENVPLKSFIIHWHNGTIKRYNRKIEVSEDGENWTEVVFGKNAVMKETVDLRKYSAKYIRLSGTDGRLAVDEVQVYTQ